MEYDRLRVTIDGQREERGVEFVGEGSLLDLYGPFYIGGLGLVAKAQAIHKNLESLGGPHASAGSVIGCLQNVRVNGRLLGFREAEVFNVFMIFFNKN